MSARTRIKALEIANRAKDKPERLPGADWADMLAGKQCHDAAGPDWDSLFRRRGPAAD